MGSAQSSQEFLSTTEQLSEAELRDRYTKFTASVEASDLAKDHPPAFHHPYKKIVYDIAIAGSTVPIAGEVTISRWRAMPVSSSFPPQDRPKPKFSMFEDVFQYGPGIHDNVVEWHVNFADPSLFVAYGGGLFAQDEIQNAEHPILPSVRSTNQVVEKATCTVVNHDHLYLLQCTCRI